MAWKPIDGRGLTVDQFAAHVAGLNFTSWKPSGIAVHNTGNPALNPLKGHGSWHGSSTSPQKRVNDSLVGYYKGLGWSSGPHMFVDDQLIWLFTPLTTPGTHSPSWNGSKIGIEMVGDYDLEAFNSGPGAKVRDNTVAALAILHAKLGLDPDTIKLHKEDTRTTHVCPGKNVNKTDLIARVHEYMGEGGDHVPEDESEVLSPISVVQPSVKRTGTVTTDNLNMREQSSTGSRVIKVLMKGVPVTINREEMNGNTKWYSVIANGTWGWVSAAYVKV